MHVDTLPLKIESHKSKKKQEGVRQSFFADWLPSQHNYENNPLFDGQRLMNTFKLAMAGDRPHAMRLQTQELDFIPSEGELDLIDGSSDPQTQNQID